MYSKFEEASICATRNASSGPRIETSATSFCSEMKSFSSGGTTRRTACGRTTKRSDWRPVRPIASAAARWRGVDRVDPRAVDLGDVGRVGERERGAAEHHRAARDAGQLERGDAEPDQVDDEDRRHAAQDVDVDRAEQAHRAPARARSTCAPSAIASPTISTTISTTTNSFTSSQKPLSTSGKRVLNDSQLKNVSLTVGQPLLVRIAVASRPEQHDRGDGRDQPVAPRAPASRLGRVLGLAGQDSGGAASPPIHWSLQLVQLARGLRACRAPR